MAISMPTVLASGMSVTVASSTGAGNQGVPRRLGALGSWLVVLTGTAMAFIILNRAG